MNPPISHEGEDAESLFLQLTGARPSGRKSRGDAILDVDEEAHYVEVKRCCSSHTVNQVRAINLSGFAIPRRCPATMSGEMVTIRASVPAVLALGLLLCARTAAADEQPERLLLADRISRVHAIGSRLYIRSTVLTRSADSSRIDLTLDVPTALVGLRTTFIVDVGGVVGAAVAPAGARSATRGNLVLRRTKTPKGTRLRIALQAGSSRPRTTSGQSGEEVLVWVFADRRAFRADGLLIER